MTPTPEERAEWGRLCEGATPGPWSAPTIHQVRSQFGGGMHPVCSIDNQWGISRQHKDAAFIAAARTALPRLLSALEEAEGERDKLKMELSRSDHTKEIMWIRREHSYEMSAAIRNEQMACADRTRQLESELATLRRKLEERE